MNTRHSKLINELLNRNMSLEDISNFLKVSQRTVRNDISKINNFLVKYNSSIKKLKDNSYSLTFVNEIDEKIFKNDFFSFDSFNFNEPKDRILYIKLAYLYAENYIKLDDLADEMFISKSTIQNDLKQVKKDLENYNLKLKFKANYGMKISGDEKSIRKAISDIIYKTSQTYNFEDIGEKLLSYSQNKISLVRHIIIDNVKKSDIELSDLAMNNLIVHLIIAMKRIEKNIYLTIDMPEDLSEFNEYLISKSIVYDLENEFNIKFPKEELDYITMHLIGTRLSFDSEVTEKCSSCESSLLDMTCKKLITNVQSSLDCELEGDSQLYYGLVNHLKPAIYRLKNNMSIRNPLLESIKLNYPDIFKSCYNESQILNNTFNIVLNEDEIGFITIHFGAAIERYKLNAPKLRVLLVCTTGVGSSQLLKYKLKSKFNKRITIVGVSQYYNLDKFSDDDYDIIISTVPFNNNSTKTCIVINDILGESDFSKIEKFINKKELNSQKKYLNADDIFLDLDFNNKYEILQYMSEKLNYRINKDHNLYKYILERENIANTDYGNLVAVPHPIKPIAKETFISVGILKNKVNWGNNFVRIIIFLCLGENEVDSLDDLYERIFKFTDNIENVNKILYSKNKNDIIKLFS